MKARRTKARDYRGFPAEYAGFFTLFAQHGRASIGPLPERAARRLLHDLNTYKASLREAQERDPADTYVRGLVEACRSSLLRVEPINGDTRGADWFVRAETNPLVTAMKEGKVSYE